MPAGSRRRVFLFRRVRWNDSNRGVLAKQGRLTWLRNLIQPRSTSILKIQGSGQGRPRDGRKFYGRFGWHISGVRPGQRHAARDATRLAKSIVDSLMGQNPDRAPTRQKSREGPIGASGRGEVRPPVHMSGEPYFGGCKSPCSQRPRPLDFMGSSYAARVLST